MCPFIHDLRDRNANDDDQNDVNCKTDDTFKDYNFNSRKKKKKNVLKKNQRMVKGTKMKLNSMGFVYKLDKYLMPTFLQTVLDEND